MKQTFLSLLMLTLAFTSTSFGYDKKPAPGKTFTKRMVVVPQKFASLVMRDVNIVLTNDENAGVRVEGELDAVEAVSFATSETELTVSGKRKFSRKDKVTVYVPATLLSKIQLYGTSEISSSQPLTNENLDVFIDGNCKVNIKSYGTINVDASDNCDFTSFDKKFTKGK